MPNTRSALTVTIEMTTTEISTDGLTFLQIEVSFSTTSFAQDPSSLITTKPIVISTLQY